SSMEYSMTFLARGVWGSLPMVTMSGPAWTIFSTSRRILRRSMSRFLRTLAATPEPSLTRPRRMCSVPMYSWLKRCASWLASCITFRARSVKRSYMGEASGATGRETRGKKRGAGPAGLAPLFVIPPSPGGRRRSALAAVARGGADQLRRAGAARRVEDQLLLAVLLLDAHRDRVLAVERAADHLLGQRVLDQVLDGPPQRPGAELL